MNNREELAELVGIILGDGSLYVNVKHQIYQFAMMGHIKNDREYYESFLLPLLEKHFGKNFKVNLITKTNGIRIRSQERSTVKKISELGIPIGNKVKNNVKIPEWIFANKKLIKACIRGLVDTDGFVTPITGRNYSYIWFSSKVTGIQKSFSRSMKLLELKTSKWRIRNDTGAQIYLGSKQMIEKYYREINFNNPYHRNKFKAPFV